MTSRREDNVNVLCIGHFFLLVISPMIATWLSPAELLFCSVLLFYDFLPISAKRSSSTEVKILRRHCQKHNPCRTDGESWTCILGTEVFCNQILSLVEIYRQHLPEEVQWQISPPSPRYFQSNGLIILICVFVKISTNPSPRVRSSPSWKSKVTRGFSTSLLHDSCSPLRGSLAAVSWGEESRKTSVTRVTTHQQKKDLFLNTPASSC